MSQSLAAEGVPHPGQTETKEGMSHRVMFDFLQGPRQAQLKQKDAGLHPTYWVRESGPYKELYKALTVNRTPQEPGHVGEN